MEATEGRHRDDTAERVLDVAERLVQATRVQRHQLRRRRRRAWRHQGRVHYHFASKAELGEALIDRYTTRFEAALAQIDGQAKDAPSKISDYAAIYLDVLRQQRMCLCGMLAAEYQTLPAAMREAVVRFFDVNETWLERVLDEGRTAGTLPARVGERRGASRHQHARRSDARRSAAQRPVTSRSSDGAVARRAPLAPSVRQTLRPHRLPPCGHLQIGHRRQQLA